MKTLFSIVAACAALTAAPAMSASIVSGVIAEDQALNHDGRTDYYDYNPAHVFGDFANSNQDPNPTFEFTGEAWIFGFLGSSEPTYEDNFVIEASDYSYSLQFSVLGGDLEMGVAVAEGLVADTMLPVTSLAAGDFYQIDDLTGTNTIFMDGITGSGHWLVDVVNIEAIDAVPLPASSLMLLAGLGGLGAMRRRKKA